MIEASEGDDRRVDIEVNAAKVEASALAHIAQLIQTLRMQHVSDEEIIRRINALIQEIIEEDTFPRL